MPSLPSDPYGILSVSKDASTADIRSAYRKLVLKCHPDKVQDPTLKAEMQNKFQQVQEAYETLSDDKERRKHDELVENIARLNALKQQKSANAAKTASSPPKPSRPNPPDYADARSSSYRSAPPAPEPRPTHTTYTYFRAPSYRSSDNEPDIVDAEPSFPSRRREASYVDRERESRPSKRETERDRAYQKDRERERETEKERKRRKEAEKAEKEERRRERERKEEKEARRELKRQREKQESKNLKKDQRERAAREVYATPPADEFFAVPKTDKKSSSSRKHKEKTDRETPDYLAERINLAKGYQAMSGGNSPSQRLPTAPTPPPTTTGSAYPSPDEDEPRRRSSTRRGSSDAQRVREKRSYPSRSSRERVDEIPEEPVSRWRSSTSVNSTSMVDPPRPARTNTMPVESTHTATRPPPVPGNLARAYTDMPLNRGRGRSRLESQVDGSDDDDDDYRGSRAHETRERKSSRQPKKSSSFREPKDRTEPQRVVYNVGKGAGEAYPRVKPQRTATTYSQRGGYEDYADDFYSSATPGVRYGRPAMSVRESSYSSAYAYSPPKYSSEPRYAKAYGRDDVEYSKSVRV